MTIGQFSESLYSGEARDGGSGLRSDDSFFLTLSNDSGSEMIGICGGIEFFSSEEMCNAFKEGAVDTPKSIRLEAGVISSRGDMARVEALSKSDVSFSSVENLHRSFQFGGSDPFRTASRVVRFSSSTRWN